MNVGIERERGSAYGCVCVCMCTCGPTSFLAVLAMLGVLKVMNDSLYCRTKR